MVKIRQARTSPALSFFEPEFLEKYGLEPYSSPGDPALFFGCYGERDLPSIRAHRGFKVVLWGGTDAMDPRTIRAVRRLPDCHHIAISRFIEQDLATEGVPFVRLPVSPRVLGDEFAPCPRGPAIYVYTSLQRPEFYGAETIEKLRRRFADVEFIFCTATSYGRADLIEVYRRCFMGLRLVAHDGLSNTVLELGLLGRRTVHNGGLPGSLSYASFEDICHHIEAQRRVIGMTDFALGEATRRFLVLPDNWLTTEYIAGATIPAIRRTWWGRLRGRG